MPLKAVLFDMDGVIVDTEPLHKKAYKKAFDELKINVSDELYATFNGASTMQVCHTVKREFNLTESAEEIASLKRKYFKYFFDHDQDFDLFPGVLGLMKNYHENGVKLVLASSAHRNTINWVFEKFDLEKYFIGKISGADLLESKPNPEIFILASKMADEPTENCMVIEDSTNGILAAHRAGIFCAAYKSKNTHLQDYAFADLVVGDFEDLKTEKVSKYFKF